MTRIPTVEELCTHARELAAAFHIQLMEVQEMPPEMAISIAQRRIAGGVDKVLVRYITDEVTYAIALHEIGHCIHPSGSMREAHNSQSISLKITEEESAWEWAKHHSLDWTPSMEHVRLQSMNTYYSALRKEIEKATHPRKTESLSDFLRRIK